MTDYNNTTEIERVRTEFWQQMTSLVLEYELHTFDPNIKDMERDLMRAFDSATAQLQNLLIKERQAELAQTILAGMPGLTPTQQDFVTNRIQELQKELEANEVV